jgi:hypothetical protein
MLSGNKGEWSEIYTLLKVISDKQLHAGDKNLEKIENIFYPIIKILRNESNGTYDYSYSSDLVVIRGSEVEFQIPIFKFQEKAAFLLSKLKEKTDRTFCIPEIENFIRSFHCTSAYASSKFAVYGFFETVHAEYYDNNIRVVIVCPGRIKTNISYNALEADGSKHAKMDEGQNSGMSAEKAAKKIVKAIIKQKPEVLVGGKELLMVYIKRFLPGLSRKMVRRVSST